DPRDRLDVVGQHLRAGSEHGRQPVRLGVEVGDEQFYPAAGDGRVDLDAGLRVQPGAAVGQVVPGHPGHGRVAQAHRRPRLGPPVRLASVQRLRLAGRDLAEVTPAGALVAADQERRLAVLPAFEDVGTARFLTDGVQALAADQVLQRGIFRTGL